MRVGEALDYLVQEEEQKLIDMDQVTRVAIERVERSGIVFLDEVDKSQVVRAATVRRQPRGRAARHPADRRRHHRQHALRFCAHGSHLFIAAGAFHVAKPSDLILNCRAASQFGSN